MVFFSGSDLDAYIKSLSETLERAKSPEDLYKRIVNEPFRDRLHTTTYGLGFITLVLVNKKTSSVNRISMTDNDLSQGARSVTVIPFEKLIVPLDQKGNCVVEAIKSGRYQQTNDWYYLLTPVLKPEEARLNQAGAGIASSYVYPLVNTRPAGALIFQFFITMDKVSSEHRDLMFRYTKVVSQSLNNLPKKAAVR